MRSSPGESDLLIDTPGDRGDLGAVTQTPTSLQPFAMPTMGLLSGVAPAEP